MSDLANLCSNQLLKKVGHENACSLLIQAHNLKLKKIRSQIMTYLQKRRSILNEMPRSQEIPTDLWMDIVLHDFYVSEN